MNWPLWWCRNVARLDYGWGLKALAQAPQWVMPLGVWLRGSVNFALDLDWRTLSLRHGYVRRATYVAMRSLCISRWAAWRATHKRFVCAAQEETDAVRLARLNVADLHVSDEGIARLQASLASGQGAVLLTAHFDSLYVGLAALAQRGVRVNLLSSKMVEDARIPPEIRRFFSDKIDTLNSVLTPGRVMHYEDGVRFFVDALKRGEVVVIAADGPATQLRRASEVDFLGQRQMMSGGAAFFAEKARVPVCAYQCHRKAGGCFHVQISPPTLLGNDGLQKAYSALDAGIRQAPWRWWAADLFGTYQTRAVMVGPGTASHMQQAEADSLPVSQVDPRRAA